MNAPEAPDPRKVAEAALDVFVYAPVGLALEAKELLPKLAERGRNQIVLARLGARFAVQKAEAEAEKLLARLQPTEPPSTSAPAAPAAPSTVVVTPAAPVVPTATSVPSASTKAATTSKPKASTVKPKPTTSATKRTKPTAKTPARATAGSGADVAAGAPAGLAITGYDTLSASQVVPRLDALRPAELEAIRRHELAHRGRRTILSRIAQLQG